MMTADDDKGKIVQGVVPSDAEYGDMIVEVRTNTDEHEDLDKYISAQLLLDVGGEKLQARVVKHKKGEDGRGVGHTHQNPLFDTRAYIVEFPDGSVDEYTANIIAENIYSQVNEEGKQYCCHVSLEFWTTHFVE